MFSTGIVELSHQFASQGQMKLGDFGRSAATYFGQLQRL